MRNFFLIRGDKDNRDNRDNRDKKYDEGRGGRDELLAEHETEQDGTIENNLILLISELEQLMVRVEGEGGKRPTVAIELISGMVNRVAGFSERVMNVDPRGGFLGRVLTKVSDKHPQMQLVHVQGNRLSVKTALNLYVGWAGDRKERHSVFGQICVGMVEVMGAYFSFFSGSFRSSGMRGQWKETYAVFTSDLLKIIDKIQF